MLKRKKKKKEKRRKKIPALNVEEAAGIT